MPQSLAKVYLHAVFSTKDRHYVLGGATNNLGCQSLIVGGVADHVHLLFQLGRTITIANVIGKIKTTSCLWIGQTHAAPPEFRWQAGYEV